jgi:hypothetical protein
MTVWILLACSVLTLGLMIRRAERARADAARLRVIILDMFDVWRAREQSYRDALEAKRTR